MLKVNVIPQLIDNTYHGGPILARRGDDECKVLVKISPKLGYSDINTLFSEGSEKLFLCKDESGPELIEAKINYIDWGSSYFDESEKSGVMAYICLAITPV